MAVGRFLFEICSHHDVLLAGVLLEDSERDAETALVYCATIRSSGGVWGYS